MAQNVGVGRRHRYQTILEFISQKLSKKANLKVCRLSEALATIFVNNEVSSTKQYRALRDQSRLDLGFAG